MMGFLLGQKMEKVQDGITDSQIHTAQVHSYIYVTSFIPWPQHKCLYGRNGHIDEGLMKEILENSDQNIVGWYSFRQQTSQMPSMKEVSIHNKLTSSAKYENCPEEFVFLLCTTTASKNMSTHSSDHAFMVYRNQRFVNISMTVKNLGDTSRTDYLTENSSPSVSKVIHTNLGSAEKNFVTSSGQVKQVAQMKSLISSMTKGLESTQTKVNSSEAVLGLLEGEVTALRDRLALLENEEMQRAFQRAELQKQKAEEERLQQEKNQEAEEEEQMNKLLLDLGLAQPVENDALQHEQKQKSVQSQVLNVVSLPKLEAGVNPLYVSTLSEFDGPGPSFLNFNQQGDGQEGSIPIQPKMDKVQLLNSSDTSLSRNKSHDKVVRVLNNSSPTPTVQNKPKDPFDFVMEEVKSELKVKPVKQTGTCQKNSGMSSDKNHAHSSPNNDKTISQASSHKKLEVAKPNISTTNGHVTDTDHSDEHDGPALSDSLLAPCNQEDVTLSSSPVF